MVTDFSFLVMFKTFAFSGITLYTCCMKQKSLWKTPLILVAFSLSIVSVVAITYIVPSMIEKNIQNTVVQNSNLLVDHIRTFRSYYTESVLKKIKQQGDFKINYDHKAHSDTLPLPATMVHDIGEEFTQGSNLKVHMYSNYPFAHRADRKLDRFEKESLAYLIKNPDKIYVKRTYYGGKEVVRVAIPDVFTAESCVRCHNTRADSPKRDWKIGDVRGVIEVITPIDELLENNDEIVIYLVGFLLLNALMLVAVLIYVRKKELSKINNSLEEEILNRTLELRQINSRLNDYKRGIDSNSIISLTDANGNIKEVNQAFIDISGYGRDELIGQPHRIIRHPETPSEVFKEMWQTIQTGTIWQGDIKNRTKEGKSYYVHTTIVPITDENNVIMEYLAIRYDVTDLVTARDQAIAAERSKDDFLASMSHELRTPLNAIIGFSQILIAKKDLSDSTLGIIEKIHISGKNLLRLVNSILDFSKLKSGKLDYTPQRIEVNRLFQEVATLTEVIAQNKKITLEIRNGVSDAAVEGDYDMLKQSLVNFVSNAIKFSSENTKVTLGYERDGEGNHRLFVCDQGVGISAEGLEKIFEPFTQLRRDDAKSGTGLGLSIVKKMIEEYHGGRIEVTSTAGEGSCFTIILKGK
jgi:PAS domain S-box-containing protein